MDGTRTYFELLGLPVRFALDPQELEQQYREASRHWHPDRFSRAPASERAAVLQRATDLNQAYRTLKSAARRAEYLLKLRGVDLASEEPGKQPPMAPEFLGEIMELREELMDARAERDGQRLRQLRGTIESRMAALGQQVADGFARLEASSEITNPSKQVELAPLTTALLAQRYFQRFLDEISAQEEAEAEAASAASLTL